MSRPIILDDTPDQEMSEYVLGLLEERWYEVWQTKDNRQGSDVAGMRQELIFLERICQSYHIDPHAFMWLDLGHGERKYPARLNPGIQEWDYIFEQQELEKQLKAECCDPADTHQWYEVVMAWVPMKSQLQKDIKPPVKIWAESPALAALAAFEQHEGRPVQWLNRNEDAIAPAEHEFYKSMDGTNSALGVYYGQISSDHTCGRPPMNERQGEHGYYSFQVMPTDMG